MFSGLNFVCKAWTMLYRGDISIEFWFGTFVFVKQCIFNKHLLAIIRETQLSKWNPLKIEQMCAILGCALHSFACRNAWFIYRDLQTQKLNSLALPQACTFSAKNIICTRQTFWMLIQFSGCVRFSNPWVPKEFFFKSERWIWPSN